ncbi:MAG: type I-U CRISPR-associated protein Csb2 [Cyanobacteria bacterium P01_H01_bin.152]
MIHIQVDFHTNQYQACAWGNHHSEGVIDWPPAPWRLLRAIAAGSYNVHLAAKHLPTLKQLLHKLAAALPSYTLPPTTYIQHRSPRPQINNKTVKVGPGKTLYSAGLLMSQEANKLFIHWPVTLSETEELVLQLCLSGLTYLGRREAAATLTLVEQAPSPNAEVDPGGTRIVAIASPDQTSEQLWDALNLSAHENYGKNRSAVFPGVQQATYRVAVLNPQRSTFSGSKQHMVTLAVNPAPVNSPRLPMKLGLKLTNRLHQTLVSRCPDTIFTGQSMGQLSHDHNHTIIQCVADSTGRYVEQLKLYSHDGYDTAHLAVISTCNRFQGIARGYDVSLSLVDLGSTEAATQDWKSATPFFLSRFPAVRRGKPRMLTEQYQKDGPEHQVLRYLQFLPWLGLEGTARYQEHDQGLALYLNDVLTAIVACEPFPQFWEWAAVRAQGKTEHPKGKKVGRIGYSVQLHFTAPVKGPIMLGYAAHYGLGAMQPMRERLGVSALDRQNTTAMAV